MEEQWKPIPGYEGLYEASTFGRIRSAEGKTTSSARFPKRVWKQRIIKPKIHARKNGLTDERVCLWKNGEEKTLLVSRLVAMTFCPISFENFTVNHINGNPMDNQPENLEWVTHKENIQEGFRSGLYNRSKRPVILVNETGVGYRFDSVANGGRFLGRRPKYLTGAISKGHYAYNINGERFTVQYADK